VGDDDPGIQLVLPKDTRRVGARRQRFCCRQSTILGRNAPASQPAPPQEPLPSSGRRPVPHLATPAAPSGNHRCPRAPSVSLAGSPSSPSPSRAPSSSHRQLCHTVNTRSSRAWRSGRELVCGTCGRYRQYRHNFQCELHARRVSARVAATGTAVAKGGRERADPCRLARSPSMRVFQR
jgi:hypothetical protein